MIIVLFFLSKAGLGQQVNIDKIRREYAVAVKDEDLCEHNLKVLKEFNGEGIVFIKPWENKNIIEKIKLAEESGAFAVGVDIDACGLISI